MSVLSPVTDQCFTNAGLNNCSKKSGCLHVHSDKFRFPSHKRSKLEQVRKMQGLCNYIKKQGKKHLFEFRFF